MNKEQNAGWNLVGDESSCFRVILLAIVKMILLKCDLRDIMNVTDHGVNKIDDTHLVTWIILNGEI